MKTFRVRNDVPKVAVRTEGRWLKADVEECQSFLIITAFESSDGQVLPSGTGIKGENVRRV